MKSITNYLNAPSNIFKSVTKGAVILTHVVCILLLLVVALAETHPAAAIFISLVMGSIIYVTKTPAEKNNR